MTKHLQKNIATSLTALAFLVVGVSGVLMYFHLFKEYTEELHEIIGLFFVVIVLVHVFYNFKSMKAHFKTKAFWIGAILITTISLTFILNTKEGNNPKQAIMTLLLNAPITNSVKIFDTNISHVENKLESEGIEIHMNDSIDSIAKRYKVSPFHVVELINQK